MFLTVCIDLIHQLPGIVTGSCRDLSFDLFLGIGVCFDMGTVNEDSFGGKLSGLRHFLQDPCENLIHGFRGETVTEVVAHR